MTEGSAVPSTLLVLGHGTRDSAGTAEFLTIVDAVRAANESWKVVAAFLEFGGSQVPSIDEALADCVRDGAEQVVALPLLLHHAGHDKSDVPRTVAQASLHYPGVDVRLAPAVAFDPRLLQIVEERIAELVNGSAQRPEGTTVLLVGRGSTHTDANAEFHEVGRRLAAQAGYRAETCFVSLAAPDVCQGLERCVAGGARHVLVIPYFVHTGILVSRIAEQAAVAAERLPGVQVRIGRPFGAHPHLVDVMWERARSALVAAPVAGARSG